jgi:type VI secretion system protein ImpA
METVGPAQAPDMGALTTVLSDIQRNLAPYTSKVPGQMQTEGQATDTSAPGGFAINGTIQSRQDVVRLLDRICEYYARTEPSSPLPLLLRRAQRLAEMDFLQIVDELTPAMRAQLEPIVGVKPAEETPSPPA